MGYSLYMGSAKGAAELPAGNIGEMIMATLKCTWLGLEANKHSIYWVVGKDYAVEKETATQYKVKDECGFVRTVSKKTMALTGFTRECYATSFTA